MHFRARRRAVHVAAPPGLQVGTVHSTRYGDDDNKSLRGLQFQASRLAGIVALQELIA